MLGLGIVIWLKSKRDGYQPARAKRLAGIARVVAYGTLVSIAAGVWGIRSVRAETTDKALEAGRDLARVADVFGESSQISMNGQIVHMGNGVSSRSYHEVLAEYEKSCGEAGSVFGELYKDVRGIEDKDADKVKDASRAPFDRRAALGVTRQEGEGEGVVFCAVRNSDTKTSYLDALTEFAETQNLGALGQMRYAYAKRTPDGHTHVLTMWTQDKFNLGELMPAAGKESLGVDSAFVPRPPSSRRLLSADVVGTAYGVRLYESHEAAEDVVKFYNAFADEHDYLTVSDNPTDNPDVDPRVARSAYQKDGAMIILTAQKNDEGNTIVSIAEVGVAAEVGPAESSRLQSRRKTFQKAPVSE